MKKQFLFVTTTFFSIGALGNTWAAEAFKDQSRAPQRICIGNPSAEVHMEEYNGYFTIFPKDTLGIIWPALGEQDTVTINRAAQVVNRLIGLCSDEEKQYDQAKRGMHALPPEEVLAGLQRKKQGLKTAYNMFTTAINAIYRNIMGEDREPMPMGGAGEAPSAARTEDPYAALTTVTTFPTEDPGMFTLTEPGGARHPALRTTNPGEEGRG